MPTLSKDQKSKNAIKDIIALETIAEVQAYTKGEARPDVLDAAQLQIEILETTKPPVPAQGVTHSPQPSPAGGEVDKPSEIISMNDKDTTPTWIKTMENLQPKQGEVDKLTRKPNDTGLKGGVIQKENTRRVLTIRDGAPCWITSDDKGTELSVEKVPGY